MMKKFLSLLTVSYLDCTLKMVDTDILKEIDKLKNEIKHYTEKNEVGILICLYCVSYKQK